MAEREAVSGSDDHQDRAVRSRWRDVAVIGVIALVVLVYAIFEARIPKVAGRGSFVTDATLVLLININLILLVLLVFLVGRQIIKLVLDRRRGTLGANLRTRLVVAFVGIALLPATLMLIVAQAFVTNSIDRWFSREVDRALKGSLQVANAYYEGLAATSLGFARRTAQRLAREPALLDGHNKRQLRALLKSIRHEYQLDGIGVFAGGRRLARSRNPAHHKHLGTDESSKIVQDASMGTEVTVVDAVEERNVVRAAAPVIRDDRVLAVAVVDANVPREVVKRREGLDRSLSEYFSLQIQRRPIRTAYTITLVLVTLIVLFAAMWIGFYVARGITVPIQRLAEGTRRVAQGDLDHRIQGAGDDEFGMLVHAFNGMTRELKTGRAERDARRRYLETVLANVAAGVLSSEADGRVGAINPAAANMLGLDVRTVVGRPLADVFAGPRHAELRNLLSTLLGPRATQVIGDTVERHVTLEGNAGPVTLLVTGTRLVDRAGALQGVLLFFEDVTQLLRVERMEAWREVARRIAHEIKNPLTPIQLSAQRLRRRYGPHLAEDGAVLEECTRTIEHEVEALKTLVNEFATFARMPTTVQVLQDVHPIIEETLVLYRESRPDVRFTFTRGADVPPLEIDREGIRRVLVNLLDNAVAAVGAAPPDEERRITVDTVWDPRLQVVRLEIADNGSGIAPEVRDRLFEPYVSSKADGTGLGLAIVSAIMADHKGFVRVRENFPRGSRFVLDFPLRRPAERAGSRSQWGAA